ncbi:hypothetical protein ABPG74_017793 [Tetrahymena malaccensis]
MSDYGDYDYDNEEYVDHDLGYNYEIEEEEEKKANDQKLTFGQSHQLRLVKDYLFCNEIKENIKAIQDTLGISSGKALWLYQKVNYDLNSAQNPTQKLIDEVYAQPKQTQKTSECILCCNDKDIYSLECNHEFCKGCWEQYLQAGVKQGCDFALVKRCPMDKCKQIVDLDFFKRFLKEPFYKLFETFLCQDFMARNKKATCCPGKKCSNIIILNSYKGSLQSFDEAFFNVSCDCTYSFCSLCRDEAHRPLNCQKMKEWNSLVGGKTSETIDQLWIKLNTKKCPKCKVDIEKNQGCMHMTCRKCTYEFCWLCMGDWKNHTDCNKYSEIHKKEQDQIKQQSEAELQRFTFFSDRFINHKKSIEFAIKKKHEIEKTCNEINTKLETVINFDFLTEALLTIIECRRAVSFSYPLAYYISVSKRNLVEFLQKDLEHNLEKLDHKTDKKLYDFYNQGQKMMENEFYDFQRDVKKLTQTLSKYFGNMIDSFEKEMPELSKVSSYKQEAKNNKNKSQKQANDKNKKNQQKEEPAKQEEIPQWVCDYCGVSNQIDHVFCESCFLEHK